MSNEAGKDSEGPLQGTTMTRFLRDIEKQIVEKDKCRKSFNLLYSASKHGCSPRVFHKLCDAKGPTVTILIGTQNIMFGGYTSQSWTSEKGSFKSDKNAFLFYKEDNDRHPMRIFEIAPENHQWAIYCHRNNGPTFGGGRYASHDLLTFATTFMKKLIWDEIKLKNNVFELNGKTNIGSVYKSNANDADPIAINGGKMTVSDVYVYQVQDEPEIVIDQLKIYIEEHDTRLREKKGKLRELNDSLHRKYKTDHINILLLGEVRSGKSSLYNTLATVLCGKVVNSALTGPEQSSVTTRLHRYELRTEKGNDMPIQVIDIRGFTKDRDYEHEIDKILDGKVIPGYEFGGKSKEIEKEKTSAGGEYKIHVVCFVVDVTQVQRQQHSEMVTQIRKMKEKIRSRDLPVIGVATKFDVLCPHIQENVANIQKSAKALDAVKCAAKYLEIQEKCVFPVVNYTEDTVIDKAKDMLILKVLDCIEGQAKNYLEHDLDWQKEPSVWTCRINSLENENVAKSKKELLSKMKGVEESVRILCVGRTNTGKSSFIDSVMSALSGEISCRATAGLTQSMNEERDGIPDTKRYNTYQLKVSENGNETQRTQKTNVYLCDMPGIHEKNGVQLNQIKSVIEGHVPSRYKVLSGINEESQGYVKEPGNKDKIHCVCLFLDENDVSEREMKCILELKSWLRDNEIPLIAVVTKIDLLSEELRAGRQNPYCVQRLTESIVNIERKYGFNRKIVYPVRNYVHEVTVKGTIDDLLLAVFKEILMLAIETKKQLDEDGTVVDP